MPSRKSRLMLTLPDDTHAAISELAMALGKPKATIVAEFLVDASPNFRELARVARHFKLSPSAGLLEMQETVGRMSEGLNQAKLGLDHAMAPPIQPASNRKPRPRS